MLMLDAFCCQGGASWGYRAAGFQMTGVDKDPQVRYPFGFVQADAVQYIREHGGRFAARHTSPPCQHDSKTQQIQGNDHPDLIAPTRAALLEVGGPYIIENVGGAEHKLVRPMMLCGLMFGLKTHRHRYFETNFPVRDPGPCPDPDRPTRKMGRRLQDGDLYHAVGHFSGVDLVRQDMGVRWMNRDGIRECIPPVYAAYIGLSLARHLSELPIQIAV